MTQAPLFDQERYLKAWNFASHAHKNQLFINNELPYLTHIGYVVMEVIAIAATIEDIDLAISCAILHDTIEDTEVSYDDIASAFSKKIADGVMALTKNETLPSKQEQMIDSLNRTKQEGKSVWAVKLADRISNLKQPPQHWDQAKIKYYREEARLILENLKDANTLLATRLEDKIEAYQSYIV